MQRIVLIASLAACAKHPGQITGKGYDFKIPAGWSSFDVSDKNHRLPAGVRVEDAIVHGRDGVFFIIEMDPAAAKGVDPARAQDCEAVLASAKAASSSATGTATIVDGPFGKTCQVDIASGSNTIRSTMIIDAHHMLVAQCGGVEKPEIASGCRDVLASLALR